MRQKDQMASKARAWVPAHLENGPQSTRDLVAAAARLGISRDALVRVLHLLDYKTARRQGIWWWYCPEHEHLLPPFKTVANV